MKQIKTVRNRWNKKTYRVLMVEDNSVVLERNDGTQFIITKSEYFFNYVEKSC